MISAPPRPPGPLLNSSRLNSLAGYGILDSLPEPGFDDIVNLARQICGTPVALVSLVGEDRQWFKARAGFERCEVPLNQSVCTHTLTQPDLLVISDLSSDPRTRANPLVSGEPYIRFYAGAPLQAPDGEQLGALCVIGHEPRPEGLTTEQATSLQALARQVMIQLELQRVARAHQAVLDTQRAIQDAAGDLDVILDAAAAGVMRAVPQAEGAAIELRDGDTLALRSACGSLAAHVGLRMPVEGSLAGHCLLSGEPLICCDTLKDPRVNREMVERVGARSCVLVPVARAGGVLGVLRLQSSRPGAFSQADLEVTRLFAGTVVAGMAEAGEAEARRASRRSEARYRTVFDSAIDFAVIVLDLDGRITDWNEGATRVLGWSSEEMVGRRAETFFTPEDRDANILDQELQSALTAGRGIDERWHLRKDGNRFWASGEMMPLRDEGGVATGYVKILRDRTEQREAGVALEESELRYRSLVEVSPQVVWFGDAAGSVTYCNAYWYDYTGLPAGEITEASWMDAIHPDHRERVRDTWYAAAQKGAIYEVEFPLRRGVDGQYRWFLSRGRPLLTVTGAVQSWIGVTLDIHERKLAEQRFHVLTELAPSIIWFSGPDGSLSYLNDRWYAYTGQTAEQAMPYGWTDALHPDDVEPLQEVWAWARVHNELYEAEARFRRNDGAYRWFLIRAEPLLDEAGAVMGWIGTDTDIHDRREAEAALRESERQLSHERGFLRAIFHQAPVGISIAGATLDVPSTLNARAEEMLGHGLGEPGDARYVSYHALHTDDRPYAPDDYPTLRALRRGEVIRSEEMRYRNAKTGQVRRFEVSSAPVRDEVSEIRAAVTLLVDVEDQRRVEAEIRRLATIVEQSGDFVGIARADGTVEYVNEAGRRMVGLADMASAQRSSIRDYFMEEDWPTVEEVILPAVAEQGAWVGDFRFRNQVTGTSVPVHYNLFAVRSATGVFEGYATVTRDITERKEAEARQEFLNGELSHRMKNLLAMVQAITVQTLRTATDLPTVREVLVDRLITLGKAHDLLLGGAAERTPIEPVIRNGIGVQDDDSGRIRYAGPEVEIDGKAALSLAMMVHELATNAAKYGALLVPGGRVSVSWSIDEVEGEPWLRIAWVEQGGPPVTPPSRKGFGSRLIERGLSGQVGGSVRLEYPDVGVRCFVEAPLRGFQQDV